MKFPTLVEANKAIAERSKHLHEIFEQAGDTLDMSRVTILNGDSAAKAAEIRRLNAELTDWGKQRDDLRDLEQARATVQREYRDQHEPSNPVPHPTSDAMRRTEAKSIGRLLVEHKMFSEFKSLRQWPRPIELDVDIRNAVFRTGAGWATESMRLDRVELNPQRPIRIVDVVPQLPTSQAAIKYMEETTFTNNAAETAESTATTAADLIPENAFALTERTQTVEWLPVFVPVTMQQMEDVEGIEEYVDQRLQYSVRARLDSQLLNGNGNTPNLKGTLNIGGSLQTQAKGADPTPDAIYKAMRKVRSVGFAEPSVLLAHPNDWEDVRLLRTADGVYIWGSPADPGPDRVWGVPVIQSTAVVENTMITGDYVQFSALYTKRGITIAVSDSHAHYFTRGMLAIRADMRCAMVHFRTAAFATVTGV